MMSRNFTLEQLLIDQLSSDDASALEELTRRYSYSLYTYCMSKLNSREDAKRVVRNIFIALWEDRHCLPASFSLSLHLYTEVRKGVVQCVNGKLKTNQDIPVIEKQIIPGFSAVQLQEATKPIKRNYKKESRYPSSAAGKKSYEEHWWDKYSQAISLKGLKHAFQNMLNMW
jgi:DNA-directed RNA polymerase specialized sigma24 family protein